MPVKKEIAYPIFLECCPYAVDTFWENIFEDLAYGKTPYGTYISKDFLCCSYRKKDFSYKIERKDAKQIYEEVYTLFTTKLGLFSPREKAKQKKAFDEFESSMRSWRDNWSNIRKKNTKELLIELYVIKMKNKYSLSLEQSKHLLSILFMAMVFRVITSEDIVYQNGHIQNIKGIRFMKNRIIVDRDLYNIDTTITPRIILEKKLMSSYWTKYLKELKRNERFN